MFERSERARDRLWRAGAIVLCVLAPVGIAACGSDDGGGETDAASEGEGAFAEGTELAALAHFQGPYTQQIMDGAQVAADQTGAELTIAGPSAVDPPAHVKAFQDTIAAGAEGVATVAFLPDFWVRPIDQAVERGIPVNTFDIASPESEESVHVGPSNDELGRAVGEAVIQEVGADVPGTVVPGICVPGNPVLEARVAGFAAAIEGGSELDVEEAVDVTADPTENLTTWEQVIRLNADAAAFAGFCAFDLPNLVKIKERDPNSKYQIFGTDLEPDALRGVEEGIVSATFGQKPFVEGYLAIHLLASQVAEDADYSGWADIGVEEVNAENIDEVIAREESLKQGSEETLAYYQKEIDAVLDDPTAALKPLSDLSAELGG